MDYKFYQVDVFTRDPFGGNPLAVFPEAEGLGSANMLQIAREMNLSETTFVFPADWPGVDFEVRIFTPEKEIPFGGHPILGTAYVLRMLGKAGRDPLLMKLGTKVGPIDVTIEDEFLYMTQKLPVFENTNMQADLIARGLSLNPDQIDSRWPIQIVSTGFPALLVPLKDHSALGSIRPNLSVLEEVLADTDLIYPFSIEDPDKEPTVHARAFAPFVGIPEDPGTGSVAGAMGSYLVNHRIISDEFAERILIRQGIEMGRPSNILVRIGAYEGNIGSVQVGGTSRLAIEGTLKM